MRWTRSLLAMALMAWIPGAPAETPVAGLDPAEATSAIQDLGAAWFQATERAVRQQGAIDRASLASLDARLQAIRKQTPNLDPAAARKLFQVEALLANARRHNELRGRGESASLPYATLAPGRPVEARAEGAAGSSCALAAMATIGHPLATSLATAGSAGDAIWLRVRPLAGQSWSLSTLGSQGDVDVTAYAGCDSTDPLAYDDDYYGLQALLTLPEGGNREIFVRIGNREAQRSASARIEVVLASGFSGRVSVAPAQVAVAGLQIGHFEAGTGFYRGSGYVQPDGSYSLSTFGDGSFNARTGYFSGSYNVINEAFPDVVCNRSDYISIGDCTPGTLGVIAISGGQTTTGIDFLLETGRGLGISMASDASGAPVPNANVTLADAVGVTVAGGWTDQSGRARIVGLRPGVAYYARFEASGFHTEAFDDVPCPAPCTLPAGTPITFAAGGSYVRELAVGLAARPALKVYVRELPTATESPDARLLFPSGQTAAYGSSQGTSDIPGWRLLSFVDPPPGNYYVIGGYYSSSFSRLHPGIDCLDNCTSQLPNAQLISIQSGQAPAPVFLEPRAFPKVEGTVLEAGSSAPVSGEVVLISVPDGAYRSLSTGNQGDYRFAHVRPGSYLVVARSGQHVDVGYPNVPCNGSPFGTLSCPNASPVQITSDVPGFRYDFSLNRSASVSGSLRLEGRANAYIFSWVDLSLRRADGSRAAASLQLNQSQYTLSDVDPGSYRVVIEPSSPLHGQVYPGIHCGGSSCPVGLGQTVAVSAAPVSGIDFDLRLARGVKGIVLASPGGQPLAGVPVDIWEEMFSGQSYVGSAVTGADGRFVFANSGGFTGFRVATSVGPEYVNEVYNNVACPLGPAYFGLCSLTSGSLVSAAHPVDSRGITLRLAPSDAGVVFEDGLE